MVAHYRHGYHEIIEGRVALIAHDHSATTIALTAADANDAWNLQLYLVPSVSVGRASFGGTLELYQPLSRAGTYDLDVNPINALIRIAPGVSAGPSYRIGLAAGALRKQVAGLMIPTRIPRGGLTDDWRAGLSRSHAGLHA